MLRAAHVCGLCMCLCLARLGGTAGFDSGALVLSQGGNNVNNATLLVAYTPDGSLLGTVNLSASVPGLYTAAPPALSPDSKYAFQFATVSNDTSNAIALLLVTDLDTGTVETVANATQAPVNCSFTTGLEAAASAIAIGYGHAPRTYFLWAQLICYNGDTDLLPSGSVHCEDQYLVRYIYEPSANTLALAERYPVSHDFNCKTSWATKDVQQLSYEEGTLLGYGYRSQGAQDNELAFFTFDPHARVFRTVVETPTRGPAINCTRVAAVAQESADGFAFICLATDSVRSIVIGGLSAVVLPPQAGLVFTGLATASTSPLIFVLATTTAAFETGQELGSPATVFAVLKATGEVAHRFDIVKGAGGLAVVP